VAAENCPSFFELKVKGKGIRIFYVIVLRSNGPGFTICAGGASDLE